MDSGTILQVPEVSQVCGFPSSLDLTMTNETQAEINAFHAEHFSAPAIELFTRDFFQPQADQGRAQCNDEYYEDYDEEDDGLGYYPDGVKRTLTDEQIAIFRHSELEALRRAEEKKATGPTKESPDVTKPPEAAPEAGELSGLEVKGGNEEEQEEELEEEGEIESDTPKPDTSAASKKKKKRRNKKQKNRNGAAAPDPSNPQKGERGWFKKTIKPDLRKRTWDVVEAGMDSLDYDGLEASGGLGAGSAAQRRKISYDD